MQLLYQVGPRFTAVVEYVKAASSNKQLSSSFWPVLSMLFLLLPVNDVKELQVLQSS